MTVEKEPHNSPYYTATQGHISALGFSAYEAISRALAQLPKAPLFALLFMVLLSSPIVSMGAQRTLTVKSLNSAYTSQVRTIDARIATLNAEIGVIRATQPHSSELATTLQKTGEISQLQDKRATIEVTYQLILEALK